jgi:hypothetical protein
MKTAIIISILLTVVLSSFVEAQLTKDDIRQIIKEENTQQEERLKQYIDAENAKMRAELKDEIGKNRTEIAVVKEGLEFLKWVMGFLALLMIGAIAIPSMVQTWSERKESKHFEQITMRFEQLEKVVDTLRDEVAVLKKQRIVKP